MVKKGDRIELVYTNDPHTRLKAGDKGTVLIVAQMSFDPQVNFQIGVSWDSGSCLHLLDPIDQYKIIRE